MWWRAQQEVSDYLQEKGIGAHHGKNQGCIAGVAA